jgi:hypothetical protein
LIEHLTIPYNVTGLSLALATELYSCLTTDIDIGPEWKEWHTYLKLLHRLALKVENDTGHIAGDPETGEKLLVLSFSEKDARDHAHSSEHPQSDGGMDRHQEKVDVAFRINVECRDIQYVSRDGRTPLMVAAEKGLTKVVRLYYCSLGHR